MIKKSHQDFIFLYFRFSFIFKQTISILNFSQQPMFVIALVFSASIFLSRYFIVETISFYGLLFITPVTFSILIILHSRRHGSLFSFLFLATLFFLGFILKTMDRFDLQRYGWHTTEGDHLIIKVESKSLTAKGSKLICKVLYRGIDIENMKRTKGKIIIYSDTGFYDHINISSNYYSNHKIFPLPTNKNPLAFNYGSFLKRKKIFGQIYLKPNEQIILLNQKSGIYSRINSCRYLFSSILNNRFERDIHSGILNAMTLGIKDYISNDYIERFRNTGAVHILAVSGLHVGIIASILIVLFNYFNGVHQNLNIILGLISILGVWIYVVLSGSAPSSVRAGIMFSLYYLGWKCSKSTKSLNIIGLCAFIMLLLNPDNIYDLGFQFHSWHYWGIILFFKKINDLLLIANKPLRMIWQLVCISISAQIFVGPLSIYYFNQFPNYFILSGIVATPFAGLLISLGILNISMQILNVSGLISKYIVLGSEKSLDLFISIITTINDLPSAVTHSIFLSEISLLIIMMATLIFALYLHKKNFSFLIFSLILMIFQMTIHIHTRKIQHADKTLIVYDHYNTSVTDIFSHGHLISILADSSQNNANDNFKKFRLSQYPQKTEEIIINNKPKIICLDDLQIMFYPKDQSEFLPKNQTIDILVINKNTIDKIKHIAQYNDIKTIVIDGTVKRLDRQLNEFLDKTLIPFHHTPTHGPYILNWS